jgi:hypothetical protein
MQRRAVRRGLTVVALLVLPALTGCNALGLGAGTPGGSASATPSAGSGNSWVVVQQGKATGSPSPSAGTAAPSASPSWLLGSPGPTCPADWSGGSVLIPMTVTAGTGSLTASWPRQGGSTYRIAAVLQHLVGGIQPTPVWQNVPAGSGCTVTATVSGLKSGKPYILWLAAPSAGFQRDGTPNRYSGRSQVVYPG